MNISLLVSCIKKHRLLALCVFGFVLLGLYAAIRITGLKSSPPFIDEFIYVRWAQLGYMDASKRLISLGDGKQPLYIWLISLTMRSIANPLIAGKFVSLAAGAGTMVGAGVIAYLLFARYDIAYLSMFLYALYPFAIVHDRLAIYDGLVAFWYTWMIVGSILFIRRPTLGKALLLANIMGAALLTKSTANIFYLLIPMALMLVPQKTYRSLYISIALYGLLIVGLSYLYQSVVYLSVDGAYILTRNAGFVRPIATILSLAGVRESFANIFTVGAWIFSYATLPVLIIACTPFFIPAWRKKELWFLLATILTPLFIFCSVGTNIFPRHIFSFTIPILILAAYAGIHIYAKCKTNLGKSIIVIFLASGFLFVDYAIIHSFPTAPIPTLDRFQFSNGWPAGYGVREIIRYLAAQRAQGQIVIAAEGSYGSFPKTASELYFSQTPGIHIIDFREPLGGVPPKIVEAAQTYPVYIWFNKTQKIPRWPMTKIMEFQKGVGTEYMRLFLYTPKLMVPRPGIEPG